jgi:hypothetical protein
VYSDPRPLLNGENDLAELAFEFEALLGGIRPFRFAPLRSAVAR